MVIIYRLYSDNLSYIGSTKSKLYDRIAKHKYDYKQYLMTNKHYLTSFEIMKYPYKYEILELCDELVRRNREQYWIDNVDCVNIQNPDKRESRKVISDRHYKKYKEKRLEYSKLVKRWKSSWGGDSRYNNNLLSISLDLFN